jgi:hypothetical protein
LAWCLIYGLCGFISSIGGGIVCDKLSEKNKYAKSWVLVIQNILGLPLFAASYLITHNFWIALSLYALKMIVSESFISLGIAMI